MNTIFFNHLILNEIKFHYFILQLIRVDRVMQQMEREVEKKHTALTLAEEERDKLGKVSFP